MSAFSGTVAALLAGKKVNAALLITIQFNDGQVVRLWTGMGNVTIGRNTYKGAGRLISVEGLDAAVGTSVPNTMFKLSGVDAEISKLAITESNLVYGSIITVAVQMFGDGVIETEWQPIDDPVGIGSWIGDQLQFDRQGPNLRTITLTAVSFFATRSRPQSSYYTLRDQELRYPGDGAGVFIATLVAKNINWPFAYLIS
jgi:hypothetical protein